MQSFIEENIIFKYTAKQNQNPNTSCHFYFQEAEISMLLLLWIMDPSLFWQIGNVMGSFDGGEAMF